MLSHFRESGARFGVCEWDGSVRVDGNEQSQRLLEAATLEGAEFSKFAHRRLQPLGPRSESRFATRSRARDIQAPASGR